MTFPSQLKNLLKDSHQMLHNTAYKYLGMVDKPNYLRRNIIGAFLVTLPEVPTYFIPAFTQAKATGTAKDIKKNEGARGLLTGSLEGLAVGAIVGNEQLCFESAIPFMLFGAAMQFVSSKVFPIVGESLGKLLYKGKTKNGECQQISTVAKQNIKAKLDIVSEAPALALVTPQFNAIKQNNPVQPNNNITKPMTNNANLKI